MLIVPCEHVESVAQLDESHTELLGEMFLAANAKSRSRKASAKPATGSSSTAVARQGSRLTTCISTSSVDASSAGRRVNAHCDSVARLMTGALLHAGCAGYYLRALTAFKCFSIMESGRRHGNGALHAFGI